MIESIRHSFAEKTMRWLSTIICLACITTAAAQAETEKRIQYMVGMELTSAITSGTLSLCANCGFAPQWSIHAMGAIDMTAYGRHTEDESTVHDSDLKHPDETLTGNELKSIYHTGISLQYWPERIGKGLHLDIGGIIAGKGKSDCTIGIGYMFRIWKGIAASLSYEARIREISISGETTGKEIKFHIYYMF